tara:strand:- start:1143 stop:1394 length:252 start_codon:yes stop_codon:yes gene_type:complete
MKVREPLRVESDWIQCHDITYRSLADAVMDVGPAPCTRYECDRIAECKRDKVECFAFRIWVNNGGELNSKQQKKIGTIIQPIK